MKLSFNNITRWLVMIINITIALWLLTITGPKLYKMFQIKGWLPGAKAERVTLTQIWLEVDAGQEIYWIAWTDKDIRIPGNHRINMQYELWKDLQKGSRVEIIKVPQSDKPYLRDGIFVSPGNFVFDFILLSAALIVLIYGSRKIYLILRRR